jgi:hypothetical protein
VPARIWSGSNAARSWTGIDGRINVQKFLGSQTPADVTMLADSAIDRPAIVVHNGRLQIAFTAPDGSIHVMASDDAHVFDTIGVLDVGTGFGPGLASFNGHTLLAWADPAGGQIHVRDIDDGSQTDLADTSSFAPALLGVPAGPTRDSALYLAWTGTDSQQSLNTRAADSLANLSDPNAKKTLPDTSIDGPVLAWREDFNSGFEPVLYLGWTGRPGGPDGDNHLNIAGSNAGVGGWSSKTTVASTSNHGPALTYFNQSVDPDQGVLSTAWSDKSSLRIDTGNYFDLPVIPT